MKLIKKLINIICWTPSLGFTAVLLSLFGYIWYRAILKRAAEIGWGTMAREGFEVVVVFAVMFGVIAAVGYSWEWSRKD